MTDARDWRSAPDDGTDAGTGADRPLPPELDPRAARPPLSRPVRPTPPPPGGRRRQRAAGSHAAGARPAGSRAAGARAAGSRAAGAAAAGSPAAAGSTAAPAGAPAGTVLPGEVRTSRRGRRVARALSWVAVVTSASVLATAGAGYALLQRYDGNINRITGVLGDDTEVPADDGGPRTVLIVGSDSRDVEGEAFQGRGDELVTGQRSDVIILAHLYGDGRTVELVSIPRDSWVEIPAHVDPATGDTVPLNEAKVNSAFFDGGPALLVSTVERLTGLTVDHYMQVDFDGFRAIIDELDGVEVCLSKPARERKSGIDLPAGVSTVRGEQALAFVRQRQGLAQGDIDRIQRQQRLIGALVRKVTSRGVLLNPIKLNGVLEIATSSLQVDEGLTFGELRELATRMRSVEPGSVVFTTVPIEDPGGRREGQSVVLLDPVGAGQLFDRIARDAPPGSDIPPDAGPPAEPLIVAPERIRVAVFNGSGVPGVGRTAADDLKQIGFLVGTPETRGSGTAATVVRHGPDRADSARTVAAALPGATIELDPDLGGVVEVVVGSSYDGAQPVTVTGPEPATPPPGEVQSTTADADPCGV